MYKTVLNIDVEVETQFGPQDAVKMIDVALVGYACFKSATLNKISSDWKPNPQFPLDENIRALKAVPIKLK